MEVALGSEGGESEPSLFGGDFVISICTLIIFGLVVLLLARFAWGPLLSGLQKREKFIRESLESARRDREEAEARLREYEERLQKARDEATALVEEGRRDADVVKRRIEEEARASADATIERAKREIGVARDTALRDLYQQSADLAMHMAGTVLKRQLSPEDHQRLVDDALADLGGDRSRRN
jgi:F-type H+-transporting ATPase subunit b